MAAVAQVNPFELLITDHRKVATLFKKVEATSKEDVDERKKLFDQIKMELEIHAEIEEKHFYPALEDDPATRGVVMHSYEEHQGVKDMLRELTGLNPRTQQWTDLMKRLIQDVEHHVEEEEDEMFPNTEKVLSQASLFRIGALLQKTKEQLKKQKEAEKGQL